MASWIPPNYRSTGYHVPATVWNNEMVNNLLFLSTHTHTGAPGDGAAITAPRPIAHQASVVNTAATIDIWTDTILGSAFGLNGVYIWDLFVLVRNNTGVNRFWIPGMLYGATAITLPMTALGTAGSSRIIHTFGHFCVVGAAPNQRAVLVAEVSSADGNNVVGTIGATPDKVTSTVGEDSTSLQAFKLTMANSVADANMSFEILGGNVIGPIYAA